MLGEFVSKGPSNHFVESLRDSRREPFTQFKGRFFQLILPHRRRQQTVRAIVIDAARPSIHGLHFLETRAIYGLVAKVFLAAMALRKSAQSGIGARDESAGIERPSTGTAARGPSSAQRPSFIFII